MLCGLLNGWLITRLRMAPFIVTLAMLFVARGLGLWITETRAINLPEQFLQLQLSDGCGFRCPLDPGRRLAAVPADPWRTPFGRQLYAVGNDPADGPQGRRSVTRILRQVYLLSGTCAAIGGMISLAQLAAVSPNMGQGRELDAIAATVLGGTSLFGGRGSAIGSVLGAVLVETVRTD